MLETLGQERFEELKGANNNEKPNSEGELNG